MPDRHLLGEPACLHERGAGEVLLRKMFYLSLFGQFSRFARKHPLGTAVPHSSAARHARGLRPIEMPEGHKVQGLPIRTYRAKRVEMIVSVASNLTKKDRCNPNLFFLADNADLRRSRNKYNIYPRSSASSAKDDDSPYLLIWLM